MIIKSISIKRFGILRDFNTEFTSGLNIIKGPNEAGKSTLQQAILIALLEEPRKTKTLSQFRTWGEERYYEFSLDFELGSEDPWKLVKDFEGRHQRLINGEGETRKDKDAVAQIMERALGTTSTKVFRSTVCVEQDQMTDLSDGKKDIARSLEEIVTGGEEDVYTQQAIDKLFETNKLFVLFHNILLFYRNRHRPL